MAVDFKVASIRGKEQALALFQQIEVEEEKVGKELDQLLEQQSQMDIQISSFNQIIPKLQSLESDTHSLSVSITKGSELANSISHKVRTLDTAKRNVYAALKRVDDVIDLKNCVTGVQFAMESGSYEEAAAHVRRYLDLDETVLLESAADIGKGDTVSGSFALLKQAEIKLRTIVRDKLTVAIENKDRHEIDRFVRLYPLLNLHEEGINILTDYLNSEIKEFSTIKLNAGSHHSGSRAGVAYADILMIVFEEIARKFEEHISIVESCYGIKWISAFIRNIQSECDRQIDSILQQMADERMLDHKTQTIGIALNSRHTAGAIRPDPKELDTLLTELSLCSSRAELYFKFVTKKALSHNLPATEIAEILKTSGTSLKVQEIIGWYILMENYFMRETLAKAVSVDHTEPGELISSLPDDAFFVLQKSLKRAFASSNIDGACAMINNASTVLLNELKEELQRTLTDQPTQQGGGLTDLPSMFQSSSNRTSLPKGDTIRILSVSCCNIEVSCLNLKKLVQQLQNEINLLTAECGKPDRAKLDSCLAELCSTTGTFQELRMGAITYFIECAMLPDVSQAIEQFSTVSHVIEEDVMMDEEFVQKVAMALSKALDDGKLHLLPTLFDDAVLLFTTEVADTLEKQVFKSNFNQLGGVKLDRDLRQLISFLSNKTGRPIRDKFTRINQIATILSLERVIEVADYWSLNSGPVRWHLTAKDIRGILYLRRDFKQEDIENLKLSQLTH